MERGGKEKFSELPIGKLGLGVVTIFFDVIMLWQHYVTYRHAKGYQKLTEDGTGAGMMEDALMA